MKEDEQTQLQTSYERIFAGETIDKTITTNVFLSKAISLIIVAEYEPVSSDLDGKQFVIETNFTSNVLEMTSNFITYASKNGVPYPSNDIGIYSRYEFEMESIGATNNQWLQKGIVYSFDTSKSSITKEAFLEQVTNLVKSLTGDLYNVNSITPSLLNTTSLVQVDLFKNNANNIADFISRSKIITMARNLVTILQLETGIITILENIINTKDFAQLKTLATELQNEGSNCNLIIYQKILELTKIINEQEDYRSNFRNFIDIVIIRDNTNTNAATTNAQRYNIISSTQAIQINRYNNNQVITGFLLEQGNKSVVSGRVSLNGDSKYTGMYASSKILVGHYYENERGYLRRVVATDKYGKSHKDAFVKNKEHYGIEEDYIYLDLLESTKNIFSNSPKILSGVALLENKAEPPKPRGTAVFNYINKDTGETISPSNRWTNIYYKDCYAPYVRAFLNGVEIDINDEYEDNENIKYYTLLNDTSSYRLIVGTNGQVVEHNFYYTERSGDYTYRFVDDKGNTLKETITIRRRPYNRFVAPEFINYRTEGTLVEDKFSIYTLVEPSSNEIYQEAETTYDVFDTTFKYKLVTSTFIFNLVYDDTKELIDISKDADIELLPPPTNTNPVIFENLTYVNYDAPEKITTPDKTRYKVYGFHNWKDLPANVSQPIITNTVNYRLVTSKFKINFIDKETGAILKPSVLFPLDTKVIYTADDVIHLSSMQEDEYYVLENSLLATQTIIADENFETVEYTYEYVRLRGTVSINYVDAQGNSLDLKDTELPFVYSNITSIEHTAPAVIERSSNVRYELNTPAAATQKFIITPDNKIISYNYYYTVIATDPKMILQSNSSCEFRTGTKFILVSEENTIINKFDFTTPLDWLGASAIQKTIEYGGLKIDLNIRLYNAQNEPLTNVKIDETETEANATTIRLRAEGNITKKVGNRRAEIIRLVAFNNRSNEHIAHPLFDITINGSKQVYTTDNIPCTKDYDFDDIIQGKTLAVETVDLITINLMRDAIDEVFKIAPLVNYKTATQTKILNINNLI